MKLKIFNNILNCFKRLKFLYTQSLQLHTHIHNYLLAKFVNFKFFILKIKTLRNINMKFYNIGIKKSGGRFEGAIKKLVHKRQDKVFGNTKQQNSYK